MKVRDLIAELENVPQGATIYLARDAEGNEFSLAEDLEVVYVDPSDVSHGRTDSLLYFEDLSELDDIEGREDVEEVVVLWPI